MSQKYIFIVGVGRSGTTLLHSMLGSHPNVVALPETAFIRNYVARGRLRRSLRKLGARETIELVDKDQILQKYSEAQLDLLKNTIEEGGAVDQKFLHRLIRSSSKWGVTCEKDPRLIEYLPVIKKLFPDAQIVHVYRDPRDVLLSKKRAAWSRGRPTLFHLFSGRVQLKLSEQDGATVFGEKYTEVRYEDLLSDPIKVLHKLCDDLGLSFSSDMLSFSGTAQNLISERELDWKSETLGPLLTHNTGKWKDNLTDFEIKLAGLVFKRHIVAGGYDVPGCSVTVSMIQRLNIYCCMIIISIFTVPYMKYRAFSNRRVCEAIERSAVE